MAELPQQKLPEYLRYTLLKLYERELFYPDSSITQEELANEMGLSPPGLRQRIKKLGECGYAKGTWKNLVLVPISLEDLLN